MAGIFISVFYYDMRLGSRVGLALKLRRLMLTAIGGGIILSCNILLLGYQKSLALRG